VDPTVFMGVWQYVSGAVTVTCPTIDLVDARSLVGGQFTFAPRDGAALGYSIDTVVCYFAFAPDSAQMASVVPGQVCKDSTMFGQAIVPTEIHMTSAAFSVSGDIGQFAVAQDLLYRFPDGDVPCSGIAAGDVVRVKAQP
jgi:hypothetical protein